ncbi:hypothetical protein TTHERM_00156760 (macronuclear) [Tetrahymena thermophila SB210]|uniref:Uncharacterized protein n=1 Tax=Tetrahymena thermophila (strain SB210) TaxID=312017 RepID=Q22WF9_TETTS|nr:hypothetical protein TTHERM_00156760 [Tetrahymena thermophila SB210]EAR89458.1 hypothetical protein TTHERM_00156760 [Tetrahymena thermophila SB210]|eukprot:XP_001009703.1 hypothetical protein TTHERM_00156760 [Tetrahymena thermophila SB210]
MPKDRTISVYQRGEMIEASSKANEREKKNSARYPQTDIIKVQKKQSKLGTNQVGDCTRQRDATTTVAQKLQINQAAEGHLYQSQSFLIITVMNEINTLPTKPRAHPSDQFLSKLLGRFKDFISVGSKRKEGLTTKMMPKKLTKEDTSFLRVIFSCRKQLARNVVQIGFVLEIIKPSEILRYLQLKNKQTVFIATKIPDIISSLNTVLLVQNILISNDLHQLNVIKQPITHLPRMTWYIEQEVLKIPTQVYIVIKKNQLINAYIIAVLLLFPFSNDQHL